jgi:hypothetical protein
MEQDQKIKRRAFLANLLFAGGTVTVASLGFSVAAKPSESQAPLPETPISKPIQRQQGGKARVRRNRRP